MDQREKDANRRAYERFAVDFRVSIYDMRESGQQFLEESALHDVSGGGVCFLSRSPELYHAGQRLHISIALPGTDTLDVRLEGNATVAWVGRGDAEGASVGVSMDDLLAFSRSAHEAADDGNDGT